MFLSFKFYRNGLFLEKDHCRAMFYIYIILLIPKFFFASYPTKLASLLFVTFFLALKKILYFILLFLREMCYLDLTMNVCVVFWISIFSWERSFYYLLHFLSYFTGEVEDGWWRGTVNGEFGVFPSNFVEIITTSEPPASNPNTTSTTTNAPETTRKHEDRDLLFKGVENKRTFGADKPFTVQAVNTALIVESENKKNEISKGSFCIYIKSWNADFTGEKGNFSECPVKLSSIARYFILLWRATGPSRPARQFSRYNQTH